MYIFKGERLLKQNKKEEAVTEFEKVIKIFPNHFYTNLQLAKFQMEKKDWESSEKYWDKVYKKGKREFNDKCFLDYAKTVRLNNHFSKAIKILEEARFEFPMDKLILMELTDLYKEFGSYNKAETLLKAAVKNYPEDQSLFDELINIIILKRDWPTAIEKLERINNSFEYEIILSMLYKIVGQSEKANNLFDSILKKYEQAIIEDEKGYRKIIVFDNGESRIEFYKCLKKTDAIMLTFDSINMEWHDSSFAFKLLMRQNLDILAVRKKKKQTYQQDLTQQDYVAAANPIIKGYKDKMAYGFSLGAYNVLYFASLLNCRVLALSPRLSIHPVYGKTKVILRFKMEHELSFPPNDSISPFIVFDPKNALDNRYVNESILKSFPNAKLVKIPYGGHGIAPHLLKMGLLKKFVVDFINGALPKYDRKKKQASPVYFRNLGTECLKHNKLNWALQLAKRSLDAVPADKNSIKLMINVLKRLNEYEEALEFTRKSIKLVPNVLDIRLYLVDIYIHPRQLDNAETEIMKAEKKFGNKKSIIKRKDIINNIKKTHLPDPKTKQIS